MRRKRVFIPKLLFIPVICIALFSHHRWHEDGLLNLSLEILALTLVATGAMGRIWVSAYVSGKKNRELVVDGPYSIVRNPLYMFSMLAFIGGGLAFESFTFGLIFATLFFATHLPTIFEEEKFLRAKFGEQFDAYKRSVPRLFPRSWTLNGPAIVSFSSAQYSRAVIDSALIMTIIVVAQVIEWGHFNDVLPVYFRLP